MVTIISALGAECPHDSGSIEPKVKHRIALARRFWRQAPWSRRCLWLFGGSLLWLHSISHRVSGHIAGGIRVDKRGNE
jgi:hypothetical protein